MFYTNKENNDYLMIEKRDLYLILGMNINEKLYNEVISIIRATKNYSRSYNYMHVDEVALKKNNILSQFLLTENIRLINYDSEINCTKTANALIIALFEDNPVSTEILRLFKNKICGNKHELKKQYNINVINHILNNDDFNYYVKNLKGKYNPKFYVIYENGECRERKLVETSGINLTKKM